MTNDTLVLSLFSSCKCNITGWFVWYRGQVLIPLHLGSSEWPGFGWDLCSLGRDCFPMPWSFFYNQCICLLYGGQWDAASFSCCISCSFPCGAYLTDSKKTTIFPADKMHIDFRMKIWGKDLFVWIARHLQILGSCFKEEGYSSQYVQYCISMV